jgi:hypothetical protein
MTRVFECNICYENKRSIVKCFHKCSAIVCRCCFKKLIQLNEVNEISYCCPVCRELSIRHKNKKFTLYCNKAPDVLKRIVGLFENDIKLEKERQLGEAWTNFQAQIIDHDTDDDVEPFEPSSNPTTNALYAMIDNDMLPLHLQDLFSPRRRLNRSNSL